MSGVRSLVKKTYAIEFDTDIEVMVGPRTTVDGMPAQFHYFTSEDEVIMTLASLRRTLRSAYQLEYDAHTIPDLEVHLAAINPKRVSGFGNYQYCFWLNKFQIDTLDNVNLNLLAMRRGDSVSLPTTPLISAPVESKSPSISASRAPDEKHVVDAISKQYSQQAIDRRALNESFQAFQVFYQAQVRAGRLPAPEDKEPQRSQIGGCIKRAGFVPFSGSFFKLGQIKEPGKIKDSPIPTPAKKAGASKHWL